MRGFNGRRYPRRTIKVVVSVLMLLAAAGIPRGVAQNVDDLQSINPLRPADTSSPRDTLGSFLLYSDALNKERARRGPLEDRYLYFLGAEQTIDF